MKLRFLCGMHRLELCSNSEKAINYWNNGFDTGQLLYEQHNWLAAIPSLGCAFETAEIIMTTEVFDQAYCCEMFAASASLLMDAFMRLGYLEESEEVYNMAVSRLMMELSSKQQTEADSNRSVLYQQIQLLDAVREQPVFSGGSPVQSISISVH